MLQSCEKAICPRRGAKWLMENGELKIFIVETKNKEEVLQKLQRIQKINIKLLNHKVLRKIN